MQAYNKKLEPMNLIFNSLGIEPPWLETRGRKPKYFFHHLQPGQIETRAVNPTKAKAIQTALKNAATRQGIRITTQNKKTYIKIKRIK